MTVGHAESPLVRHGRRATASDGRRRRTFRHRHRDLLVAIALLSPLIIALILFRLLPVAQAAIASFQLPDGGTGLGNYRFMLGSPQFRNTVSVTVWFNLLINPIQIILSLALALLLTQRLPANRIWQTLAFAPTAIPIAVSAIVWRVAFRPDGPINAVLASLGLPTQDWLITESLVFPSLITMASWVGVGYWMIFLIAGLRDIPTDLYEAAALDGAGWWRSFFHITLPLLRRQLTFVLVADTVVNFLMFAPVQIMTGGGPNGATDLIMWETYQQAYRFDDYSLAAAQIVVVMTIMLIVVAVQFALLQPRERL